MVINVSVFCRCSCEESKDNLTEFQPSGSPAHCPASTPKGLRRSKQQTVSSCNHTMPNAKFRDNRVFARTIPLCMMAGGKAGRGVACPKEWILSFMRGWPYEVARGVSISRFRLRSTCHKHLMTVQ